MIKTSIGLQELRRKIYLKAKSEKTFKVLGTVCSCLQDGNFKAGLQTG